MPSGAPGCCHLVSAIGPTIERAWIDDCFSNRVGKGTHGAITRLQRFMRMAGHSHYCQMDVRSFFPSIHRRILLGFWHEEMARLPHDEETLRQLDAVARRIILQNPTYPRPVVSGNLALLRQIPPHKSLFHTPPGVGLPIGSLSSQIVGCNKRSALHQTPNAPILPPCPITVAPGIQAAPISSP